MPRSKCFAPGCKSGYVDDRKRSKEGGKKVCSLFRCGNGELLEKWQRAIPRGDRIFTKNDVLCELHFDQSHIIRCFETKLPDRSINRIERERPILTKDAIPCIFPNLPHYLSSAIKKRKAPSVRVNVVSKKICVAADVDLAGGPSTSEPNDVTIVPSSALDPPIISSIENIFTFKKLSENLAEVKIPSSWWSVSILPNFLICAKWTSEHNLERRVVVDQNLKIKVFLLDKEIECSNNSMISSVIEISSLLDKVDGYKICAGINDRNFNKSCLGLSSQIEDGRRSIFCLKCQREKKLQRSRQKPRLHERCKKFRGRLVCSERKQFRLRRKVATLQNKVEELRVECSTARKEAVEDAISLLPASQQESVRACHAAASVENKKSIRYTTQWVYECLLLRIKSRKAYEHLRSNNILALPSIATLGKYIKKLKGVYGFQTRVFDCLKKKSVEMSIQNRRGTLLLDEMKVSPVLSFDPNSLKVSGFTDLGKYTPDHQKTQKGDHALVFMFQPFKGTWVQVLACFLSRGAAPGDVLYHLIVQCIILLENSGFLVDAVICDGATWNRSMWSSFGINLDNVSCSHISDPERRLWFLSDFPHLIKNVRNAITEKKFMLTPDGTVNLKYWEAVVALDCPNTLALKVCPRLTQDHINPKAYMKMNVAMAFQFFSRSVAVGMQHFKTVHPESCLKNSDGCIRFINRFNDLTDAMNSRCPKSALKPDSNAEEAIKDFLKFLGEWELLAKEKKSCFISESTCYGLKISLKATLEILYFLSTKCDYKYLMTARLNQDSLERFFGMMRSACGSNDHPDAKVFLQLFRLIGTYSLVKPLKGSNISGSDMLKTLMGKDDFNDSVSQPCDMRDMLDSVLDKGTDIHIFEEYDSDPDHNYYIANSPDYVVAYVAGYVARRVQRFTKCDTCKAYLVDTNSTCTTNNLINLKSKGWLLKPSLGLFNMIKMMEECTMEVVTRQPISINTLNEILEEMDSRMNVSVVGCMEHQVEFSYSIMRFYLVTRMHFLCNRVNQLDAEKTKKTKELRKLSKLT